MIATAVAVSGVAIGCGGGEPASTSTAATSPAPEPEPAVAVTLRSDDDRPRHRAIVPDSGARTTLRGRVTRDGAPVRRERVQVLADPHPFGDGERIAAAAVTRRDGRFVARVPFGRDTEVRARLAGDDAAASPPVAIHRSVRLSGAAADERPDGTVRFTGVMTYPRDVEGDFRFVLYRGLATDRRLSRRAARVHVEEVRPGRSRVAMTFTAPEGWRIRLCVFPARDSGLSPPRATCRGRSIPNVDREPTEAERRREQDAARR